MRLASLFAVACLLALVPANAAATGLFLSWDNCVADGGAANKTSTCSADFGTNRLVAEYDAPADMANFVSIDAAIDLTPDSGALPEWWMLKNAGACRAAAASISIDGTVLAGYSGACVDTWDFGATGTGLFTGYGVGFGGNPNRARAVFAIARPFSNPKALVSGTRYLAFIWQINNVNTSTCAGCLTPVAIVLNDLVLSQSSGPAFAVSSTTTGSSPCAMWQGALQATCNTIPVHARTWGSVKALYR